MATRYEIYEHGQTCGLHYTFDNVGDGIAMHAHAQPDQWHNTVCLRGSVEIYGDGIDVLLEAGEVANYKAHRMHEVRALTAGTQIVNVFLNGRPAGWAGVDNARLAGVVDEPMLQGRYATDI